MSIQQTATTDEQRVQAADPAQVLRQRLHAVITERDFWQGMAETKGARLEALHEQHRHRLAITCDAKNCGATVGVSCSKPPADGSLAFALVTVASSMKWSIGPDTMRQLNALIGPSSSMLAFGAADRCPDHQLPR